MIYTLKRVNLISMCLKEVCMCARACLCAWMHSMDAQLCHDLRFPFCRAAEPRSEWTFKWQITQNQWSVVFKLTHTHDSSRLHIVFALVSLCSRNTNMSFSRTAQSSLRTCHIVFPFHFSPHQHIFDNDTAGSHFVIIGQSPFYPIKLQNSHIKGNSGK